MDEDNPYRSPQAEPEVPPFPANWLPPSVDPSTAIRMEGVLTAKEWKQAAAVHSTARGAAVHFVFVALLAVVLALWLTGFDVQLLASRLFLVAAVIFLLCTLLLFQVRRQRGEKSKVEPVRRLVSADAVRTDTPTSSTTLCWSGYSKYKRSDDIVLLYADPPIIYYVFPRSHCASVSDWQTFVALVESKLSRAA